MKGDKKMKKILLFFTSFLLIITGVSTTVACFSNNETEAIEEPKSPINYNFDKVSYHVLSVGNGEFTYLQVANKAVILDAGRGRPGIVAIEPQVETNKV
jgi:hypothetical protein